MANANQEKAGRCWLYVCLLALQSAGAAIIYWRTLPLYRQVIADPGSFEARIDNRLWGILAIVLVQAGYWIRYRTQPPLPSFANVLVGHLVLFLSRLVLILGMAVFGYTFILQRLKSQLPAVGYVLIVLGLFSLFLYAQELQRLGTALTPDDASRKKSP